jgi:hypothetical protein
MDHLSRVKHEFSRQADRFATAAAITGEQMAHSRARRNFDENRRVPPAQGWLRLSLSY